MATQAHETRAKDNLVKNVPKSSSPSKCRNGPTCNDPDHFGLSGHLIQSEVKCRYQETCYKETCPFKHTAQRESFLEGDKSSKQTK